MRRAKQKKLRRPETINRDVRKRFFYSIAEAGQRLGMSRSASYRAAEAGQIRPIEVEGKLKLVPRGPWDREVKRLLGAET
jgi:hypothetical protein